MWPLSGAGPYSLRVIGPVITPPVITAVITCNYNPPGRITCNPYSEPRSPAVNRRETPTVKKVKSLPSPLKSLGIFLPDDLSEMPVLFLPGGNPLTDAAGNQLKTGQTVTDRVFGEGIVRGTVPLEKGEGLNVLIDWLGTKDSSKPRSRGAENLTAKYPSGAGATTTRMHTGAEYESGEVYEARGRNDRDAARLRADNGEDVGEAAGAQSPPQRRAAAAAAGNATGANATGANATGADAASPNRRSPRLDARREAAEPAAHEPWLGKASRLDGVGKLVIAQYEQRIITEKIVKLGDVILIPKIVYRSKFEGPDKERQMTQNGFNISRLREYLLKSDSTPDAVKEQLASKMRSDLARQYAAQFAAKRKAGDSMAEVLHAGTKAAKAGSASEKEDARTQTITKHVAVDAAMPDDLFKVVLYCLAVLVFMCRLPFSIVVNFHFVRFLWALRPNFAKKITPRTLRETIATDLLDEVYEETKAITAEALSNVPGRPTLGMDGHKEGKHRHVETVTRAKLGISTFAGAEYMRTVRTSGQNLSVVALKYLTPAFIALVADNTGNNTGENTGLFAFVLKVLTTLFCLGCYVHVLGKSPSLCPPPCARLHVPASTYPPPFPPKLSRSSAHIRSFDRGRRQAAQAEEAGG